MIPLTLKITPNFVFRNPRIEQIPPQRDYNYVEHTGVTSKDIEYHLCLDSIEIEKPRSWFTSPLDVPKLLGNWDLMNHWIHNMWEALYNPLWMWLKPNNTIGIIHGHHRFRLLNAMDAEKIWFYGVKAVHYKIGNWLIPTEKVQLMRENDRPPRKGTVFGVCESCGQSTKWRKKTFDRVSDVRLYCQECGVENPYPWPGRL